MGAAARLAIVGGTSTNTRRGNTLEIVQVYRPRHFRTKREDNKQRRPKHGELIRFVRMTVEMFFTEVLSPQERHEVLEIRDIRETMAEDVDAWLTNLCNGVEHKLTRQMLIQALRTQPINGIRLVIEDGLVRLPRSASENMQKSLTLMRAQQ